MEIKIINIKAEDLEQLATNPRRSLDPEGDAKLKKLIAEHGFQNPLQIWQDESNKFTIICGNHRFTAGLDLGMTVFPCIEYKGTKKQAMARALSDNKSNQWTGWDFPELKDILAELDDGDFDMELTGFTEKEAKTLFEHYSEVGEDETEKLGGGQYLVVVTCENETDQEKQLERLMELGLDCKAITS